MILSKNYDIIYDIMFSDMISHAISYKQLLNTFLALFSYDITSDILYISYEFAHEIWITRCHTWYRVRYIPLISVLRNIIAIRYHMFYDISAYVMVPGRRTGTGSSWGARRQALLRPHHYQSTGDSSLSLTTQASTSCLQ